MKDKCQKYESLFIWGTEEELFEHLKTCPECEKVHQQMLKVSSLVKETKPYFQKKGKNTLILKTICASFLLSLAIIGVGVYQNYDKQVMANAYLEENESCISEMGFPVDEYGLLMID